MNKWLNLENMSPDDFRLFTDERINVDYRLWLRQKNEIVALRHLVVFQMLGIFILALTVSIMMIGWY